MLDFISRMDSVSQIVISIAIMIFAGFIFTRITKKLKLPNVTAYLVAGIVIGPYCLNLIPNGVIVGSSFISDIALAFIAFSVGEYFKFSSLKTNGAKTIVITLFDALFASLLVFVVCYFLVGLSFGLSLVLSALASATAPASIAMTIRQTRSKGEFVDTLLQVIALDDVISLIAYSVAISVAVVSSVGGVATMSFATIIKPVLNNLIAIALGVVFAFILKFLLPERRTNDNRLIIVICMLFLFCGICTSMGVSPLLGCMVIGMVYVNITKDEKLFLQVNYFSPPILLLFFVRSGMSLNLSSLVTSGGAFGSIPLGVVGIIYFAVRLGGKYLGSLLGCVVTNKPKLTRNYLGLGLIPQAGVAIGLATIGARALTEYGAPELGDALSTIIISASVLYEFVGPVLAKLALYKTGSYTDKIEELVPVNETTKKGKSSLELLIERIQKIKGEVDREESAPSKEEIAFTEAAEETPEILFARVKKGIVKNVK